jgi:hypothetical protein
MAYMQKHADNSGEHAAQHGSVHALITEQCGWKSIREHNEVFEEPEYLV